MANQLIEIEDETKLYSFNNIQLSIIGTYEEPWFVGEEICNLLGYSNSKKALHDHIRDSEKTSVKVLREKIQEFRVTDSVTLNILKKLNWQKVLISETGLYRLIFKSHMPIAEDFKDWVVVVLKEIRLKGKYELQNKLTEVESKLTESKNEVESKSEEIVELGLRRFLKTDVHIDLTVRIDYLKCMSKAKRDYVYTLRKELVKGRICPVKHPDLEKVMTVKILTLSKQLSSAYKRINKKNPDIESKRRNNLYNLEFYEQIGDSIIKAFFEKDPLDNWEIDWNWDSNEQAPEYNVPTHE